VVTNILGNVFLYLVLLKCFIYSDPKTSSGWSFK